MATWTFPWNEAELQAEVRTAVNRYWAGRSGQASKQVTGGTVDAGTRGEVTGGAHLDGFVELICSLIYAAGFSKDEVKFRTGVEVPGFFRPTKKWDIVVIRRNRLCAAIELKSQVGPSFGNNFNNRTEEAVGSSVDFWRAYEAGVLGDYEPWLGYLFFLEKTDRSTQPVRIAQTPFKPDEVFKNTSYADRYRILCERMVKERKYSAATLILSERGNAGAYEEPTSALAVEPFLKQLFGHLVGCI